MASQMMSICLHEYQKPRHKNAGVRTMKWIAQICKKKVHKSEDIVHKILSDMFSDNQREEKVELWCNFQFLTPKNLRCWFWSNQKSKVTHVISNAVMRFQHMRLIGTGQIVSHELFQKSRIFQFRKVKESHLVSQERFVIAHLYPGNVNFLKKKTA